MEFLKILLRLVLSPLVYVVGCLVLMVVVTLWVFIGDTWEIRLGGVKNA